MRELDAIADLEQPVIHGRLDRRHVEAKAFCRTVQQQRVAQRFCGGGQNDQPRGGRKRQEALDVALFDLAPDRLTCGQTESAREF
jgi:hypothetical protein